MNLSFLFSSILILSFSQIFPVIAQTEDENSSQNSGKIPPSYGTVPGIYYDPDPEAGLSPSLQEMSGATESGSIQSDENSANYNIKRAWQSGSTPDEIVKVGDLENDPQLEGVIDIKNLSLREIAESGGVDIETVPLLDIGLINSMTLNEFLQTFPQYQNSQIANFPVLNQSLNNINSISKSDSTMPLTNGEQELLERLANESMFNNISVGALSNGDWGNSLTQTEQFTLTSVIEKYPELSKVPIDKSFPTRGQEISGDWSSIVTQAEQSFLSEGENIVTNELLQLVPELGDVPVSALPIDGLSVGDIDGLADQTLDNFADIENQYLSQVGNLSQNSESMLADNYSAMLLRGDLFGRLDIPFAGEIETPIDYVLSGGTKDQIFLPEPCFEVSCKHFEVVDVFTGLAEAINGIGNVQGKAWVQGSSQSVPGGKGFLRLVNGGKERTGVSVWDTSSHVKLSLEDIDEGGNGEPATARLWLDFQICVYTSFGEHCTPHFLSFATPWKVKEKGVMIIFSRFSPSELVKYGKERAAESNGGKVENENIDR